MKSPADLIDLLEDTRLSILRSSADIRAAELAAAKAADEYAEEYGRAYKRAVGSIREREIIAAAEAHNFRAAKDQTAIELAYLKRRASDFESAQTNLQSQAKLLDLAQRGVRFQ